MAPLTAATVEGWSVDQVTSWLDSIGLGHKKESIRKGKINGSKLLKVSAEDLKGIGFSGLQIRKIQNALPAQDSTANVTTSRAAIPVTSASSGDDVAALKKQVADLQNQVRTLTSLIQRSPAATHAQVPDAPSLSVQVPGFCSACEIIGHQTQVLRVTMGPGDTIQAEPGAMVHQSSYVERKTTTGGQGLERWLTGQKIFVAQFTYHGPTGTADTVALTPDFPGQIIPVRLSDHGGAIICQRGSLLCSSPGIQIDLEFTQDLGTGFFGGEGFALQGMRGQGMVFLNARGVTMKMHLRKGEVRLVSTGCLVAFESSVRYRVTTAGQSLGTMLVGGEGVFLTEMTGPGTIWLESHNMSRLYREMNKK